MTAPAPKDRMTVIAGGKDDGARKRGRGGGSGGRDDADDWRNNLTYNNQQRCEATAHNLMLVLAHDEQLDDLFFLDEFANRVVLTRDAPWPGGTREEFTDLDGTELAAWFGSPHRYRIAAKRDTVMDCVEAIARRRARHPVREYLRGLIWDGVSRIERMFPQFFGAEDTPYTRRAAQCFMVSAVARILWIDPLVRHNGAQVDFMLVLEGEQGRGKTSAVRLLFGPQYYAESMDSPASKDFYQSLRGRWCVEIGEMDSFSKADVTKVKQAITSRFDTYRPSYGRTARSFRRECVFVGTTNESEYLRDATGGRRFLPVKVAGAVQLDELKRVRDQLWAEAVRLFLGGFPWWDLPAEAIEEQAKRYVEDSWSEIIAPWLAGRRDDKEYPPRLGAAERERTPIAWVTTTELLSWALHIEIGKHGTQEQMRVAKVMKHLGWQAARERVHGVRERRWVRPLPAPPSTDAPTPARRDDDDIPF